MSYNSGSPSAAQPFHGGFPRPMQREYDDYPYKRQRTSENPIVNSPHLPVNRGPGPGHMFYKTRICAPFMQGTCQNGSTCSFAHGPHDLRKPPPDWQERVREKETNVIGDDHRHPRMKICKRFYNGEDCPYGDRCSFVHEHPNTHRVEGHVPGRRESSVVGFGNTRFEGDKLGRRETTFISIGTTENARSGGDDGDQQKMAYWKTKLCVKWEIGQCTYGDRCHYAHGVSDLKGFDARVEVAPPLPPQQSYFVPVSMNPLSSVTPNIPSANLASVVGDGREKKKLQWKVGKKINRIYGDWLDDESPPRYS